MSDEAENFHDFYALLGVAYEATLGEIKTAYRSMAKRYHPDLNPDDQTESAARFRLITQAYEVLIDPTKRSAYNKEWQNFRNFEEPDVANEYFGQVSQKDWEFACRYFPALIKSAERLSKISSMIELKWRNLIFFEKAFDRAEQLANAAEEAYLAQFVGQSEPLRMVFRDALLTRHESLIAELGVALRVLGLQATEASIAQICANVIAPSSRAARYRYDEATPHDEILREFEFSNKKTSRNNNVETCFEVIIEIMKDLWCRVKFKSTDFSIKKQEKIYESRYEYLDGEFPYVFAAISKIKSRG
jgi:hypothetical protein